MNSYTQSHNTQTKVYMSNIKSKYLFSFSERLKEERKRLKVTQKDLADNFGLTTMTWGKYERAITAPDAYILSELSKFGIDIVYLLTGERKPVSQLNFEEEELIKLYRNVDETCQSSVINLLKAIK